MYHVVNDILPQRTVEYESKMKMVIGKLKQINAQILGDEPTFFGSPERRMFCQYEQRKLVNFPFKPLYTKLLDAVEEVRQKMDEYYKTFFCIICDGNNHKFINVVEKKVSLDVNFCKSMIKDNLLTIKLMNIKLIEYLKIL
jgi:hypothetical protein